MSPRTRPTLPSDVTSIADLQTAYLKGSLVTEFGHRFLRRFHHISLTAPSTCAFVAVEGDVIVGFVLGTLDVHAFNARVKPRILGSLATALAAPRRWRLLMSLVRGIAEREPQPGIPAELLLLVVEAKGRRRGIGRHLLGVLEAAFSAGGTQRYRVAVRSQLSVARAFYEALGFEHEQDLTVLGEPMTYLTKQIDR